MVEQIGVRAQVGRIGEASDDIFKVMKGKQNDKISSKGTKQVQVRMNDQDGSERYTDPNDNRSPKVCRNGVTIGLLRLSFCLNAKSFVEIATKVLQADFF